MGAHGTLHRQLRCGDHGGDGGRLGCKKCSAGDIGALINRIGFGVYYEISIVRNPSCSKNNKAPTVTSFQAQLGVQGVQQVIASTLLGSGKAHVWFHSRR